MIIWLLISVLSDPITELLPFKKYHSSFKLNYINFESSSVSFGEFIIIKRSIQVFCKALTKLWPHTTLLASHDRRWLICTSFTELHVVIKLGIKTLFRSQTELVEKWMDKETLRTVRKSRGNFAISQSINFQLNNPQSTTHTVTKYLPEQCPSSSH